MILCAGMGTRLRPFSDRWPKAAIPLLGRPLFRFGVELFQRAGVTALAINTHHLAEIMKTVASAECARAGLPLQIAYEPTIQGTAGGIRGLRQLLKGDHFLVLNGDVLFSVDLAPVVQAHLDSGASATMVLMPMPAGERYGAVEADSAGRVRRIAGRGPGGAALRQWHFTGLHLMSPAVFDFMSAEGPEDINRDVYPRMLDKGLTIRAEIAQEYWSDLGTPARYLHTHLDLLAGRAPDIVSAPAFSGTVRREGELWLRRGARTRGAQISGPVFFDEASVVEPGATVGPGVYLGPRARVRSGARLKRTVVLEDTEILSEEDLADTVAWGGRRIPAAPQK